MIKWIKNKKIKMIQKDMLRESYLFKKAIKGKRCDDVKGYLRMINIFRLDGIIDKDYTRLQKQTLVRFRDNAKVNIKLDFE